MITNTLPADPFYAGVEIKFPRDVEHIGLPVKQPAWQMRTRVKKPDGKAVRRVKARKFINQEAAIEFGVAMARHYHRRVCAVPVKIVAEQGQLPA